MTVRAKVNIHTNLSAQSSRQIARGSATTPTVKPATNVRGKGLAVVRGHHLEQLRAPGTPGNAREERHWS